MVDKSMGFGVLLGLESRTCHPPAMCQGHVTLPLFALISHHSAHLLGWK